MIKVLFITVGALKESYLREAFAEYAKRLSGFCAFSEINIKEENLSNEGREREIASALSSEGDKILAAIPKQFYRIALCVEGKQLSSEALAAKLSCVSAEHSGIAFIIGSSHGLSDSVKSVADMRLSVSELTFPHQLMRIILAETVYRAFSINAGTRYHK